MYICYILWYLSTMFGYSEGRISEGLILVPCGNWGPNTNVFMPSYRNVISLAFSVTHHIASWENWNAKFMQARWNKVALGYATICSMWISKVWSLPTWMCTNGSCVQMWSHITHMVKQNCTCCVQLTDVMRGNLPAGNLCCFSGVGVKHRCNGWVGIDVDFYFLRLLPHITVFLCLPDF